MAYISYDKLWKNQVHNNGNSISAKDRVQDICHTPLKLKVNDS